MEKAELRYLGLSLRLLLPAVLSVLLLVFGVWIVQFAPRSTAAALFALCLWVAAFVCMGLFMYMMRQEERLLYGCIEIGFSIGALVAAVINAARVVATDTWEEWFPGQNLFVAIFIIAAAIYILVRGLDNVGEGLKRYPRAHRSWMDLFPRRD
jgi:hypothetical protein